MFAKNSTHGHLEAGHQFGSAAEGSAYHHQFHGAEMVPWTEPGLKITRFRILTDPNFPAFDVSYCHGVLNGKKVTVELPFSQLPRRFRMPDGKLGGWKAFVVSEAKKAGVNAKSLGIFEAVSALG